MRGSISAQFRIGLGTILFLAATSQAAVVPVAALTYTGAPLETACQNASGFGPVAAGGSVTCTLTANLSISQGAPFTISPTLPAGATISNCAAASPDFVATPAGQKLPLFSTAQSPTGNAHTAIGNNGLASEFVGANTCAYTWLPESVSPGGIVLGSETFTTPTQIMCGAEVARQRATQFISNGNFPFVDPALNPSTHVADPTALSDNGFAGTVSGGYLKCSSGASTTQSSVNTGIPGETRCTVAGTTATCLVTSNLFLVTGSSLLITPATPSGTTITGCSLNPQLAGTVAAVGAGGVLPVVTNFVLFFLPSPNPGATPLGFPFTFQAQIGNSTTVPANTCAFVSLGTPTNPAGIGGDFVFGTVTFALPTTARCGTELTSRLANYIPNGSGVLDPFDGPPFRPVDVHINTYFPQTTSATISGGFLCHSGNSTTQSTFTSTGLPVESSCVTPNHQPIASGGNISCSLTNDVLMYTGDTAVVTPTSSASGVTSCTTNTPGVVATGAFGRLPVFAFSPSPNSVVFTTNGQPVQAALLDGGHLATVVPANSCAYTMVGATPPGLASGTVLGAMGLSVKPNSTLTELTTRTNVYENVAIPFGFGELATDGPGSAFPDCHCVAEVMTDVYLGTAGNVVPLRDGSLALDGSTGYAEVAASPDLNITGNWTAEAWFRDDDPNGFNHDYRQILMKGDRGTTAEAPYYVLVGRNSILAGVRTGGQDYPVMWNMAAAGLDPKVRHHVAVTFRADLNVLNLWLDGQHITFLTIPSHTTVGNNLPLEIGRNGAVAGKYWQGTIDDVRIWNVARTGADISSTYLQYLSVPQAGLVADWRMSDTPGATSAVDVVSGHTAQLHGGANLIDDVHP